MLLVGRAVGERRAAGREHAEKLFEPPPLTTLLGEKWSLNLGGLQDQHRNYSNYFRSQLTLS